MKNDLFHCKMMMEFYSWLQARSQRKHPSFHVEDGTRVWSPCVSIWKMSTFSLPLRPKVASAWWLTTFRCRSFLTLWFVGSAPKLLRYSCDSMITTHPLLTYEVRFLGRSAILSQRLSAAWKRSIRWLLYDILRNVHQWASPHPYNNPPISIETFRNQPIKWEHCVGCVSGMHN